MYLEEGRLRDAMELIQQAQDLTHWHMYFLAEHWHVMLFDHRSNKVTLPDLKTLVEWLQKNVSGSDILRTEVSNFLARLNYETDREIASIAS
jgi:hypothetical protein